MRTAVAASTTQTTTAIARPPSSGRTRASASRYVSSGDTGRPSSISTTAHAVAAWTSPTPSSVSVVPIARTNSASQPAVSPVVSIPSSPNPPSRSASTRATTKPSGMNSTPIAMNRVARARYMCQAAVRIWPQLRRCARRSGVEGRQVVRVPAKTATARSAPSRSTVGTGLLSSWTSAFEPVATASQKKSVAPVPRTPPVGTA